MGRHAASSSFLTPVDGNGDAPAAGAGPGFFTLDEATTYYIELPAEDSGLLSLMSQWDATVVITSITIEETDAPSNRVAVQAASAGNWFTTEKTKIDATSNGTGTTTTTNGVIAHTEAGAGGAIQNIQNTAARRHRAVIVVGEAGGDVRFFGWAKE